MSLSKVFRSSEGKMPERPIHFSDVVIEQLVVGSSVKVDEKSVKEKELVFLDDQIQEKRRELEEIRKQTEQIIEDAHKDALKLVEQGHLEAEGIRESAQQEGWKAGFDEGFTKGMEEAQNHILRAQEVLRMAETERMERVTGSESFLIDLAMVAVEKMVAEHLEMSTNYLPELIQTLLSEVERAFKVEVRVSAADFPSVIHHRASFERSFLQRVELLILPDRTLNVGDAVIATEYGTVDGRLGTRLEQLHKTLSMLAKEWESGVIAESKSE